MTKKDLQELEKLSPYGEEKEHQSWSCPMELLLGHISHQEVTLDPQILE